MSEFLSAAAANIGGPEDLVQRSAEARSAAGGGTVEEILAEWAGGTTPPTPSTPTAVEAPLADEPTPTPVVAETTTEPEAPQAAVSTPAPVRQFLPTPDTVNRREAMAFDQVITVATAGLKERTSVRMPRWLVAIFAAVPIIAGGYLVVNSGGVDCGEAGQMDVNFAGQLQTCDQKAFVFTPGESASEGVDLVVELQAGSGLYQANCASCHTADGSAGVGPQLNGGAVIETWAACSQHVDWVTLGSSEWPGPTYGSQGKSVGGGGMMPGFISELTKAEIIQIVLFERVIFGGQDLDEAGADCGYEVAGPDNPAAGGEAGNSVDGLAEFTAGKNLYTVSCQSCHNADGSSSVGPALSEGAVLETFPGCAAQVDWVTLGSLDWPDPTYGAQDKPVNSDMPGFQDQLSLNEIKQVVLYERVAFGGADMNEATTDCFSNET